MQTRPLVGVAHGIPSLNRKLTHVRLLQALGGPIRSNLRLSSVPAPESGVVPKAETRRLSSPKIGQSGL